MIETRNTAMANAENSLTVAGYQITRPNHSTLRVETADGLVLGDLTFWNVYDRVQRNSVTFDPAVYGSKRGDYSLDSTYQMNIRGLVSRLKKETEIRKVMNERNRKSMAREQADSAVLFSLPAVNHGTAVKVSVWAGQVSLDIDSVSPEMARRIIEVLNS